MFRQSVPKKYHAVLDDVMAISPEVRTEETLRFLKRLAKKHRSNGPSPFHTGIHI